MVQNLKSVLLEWKGNRNLTQPDFSNFFFSFLFKFRPFRGWKSHSKLRSKTTNGTFTRSWRLWERHKHHSRPNFNKTVLRLVSKWKYLSSLRSNETRKEKYQSHSSSFIGSKPANLSPAWNHRRCGMPVRMQNLGIWLFSSFSKLNGNFPFCFTQPLLKNMEHYKNMHNDLKPKMRSNIYLVMFFRPFM